MKTQSSSLGWLGQAAKLPFSFFSDAADSEDRVLTRLDDMHRSLPDTLPEKRFFKH